MVLPDVSWEVFAVIAALLKLWESWLSRDFIINRYTVLQPGRSRWNDYWGQAADNKLQ